MDNSSGLQLLSTWPLSVGFLQTGGLREVVYSFVKRVPLAYPLCIPCIRFIERNEYLLQHFTIMQGVPPAQCGSKAAGCMLICSYKIVKGINHTVFVVQTPGTANQDNKPKNSDGRLVAWVC